MNKIVKHPVLDIKTGEITTFKFENGIVHAEKGFTIASALHQAGYPVHSHSIDKRKRSLECGIGKCGACEMLVDGEIKRICITKVDGVKEVQEIPENYHSKVKGIFKKKRTSLYKTHVAIIGAGPSGLAARQILNEHNIPNLLIDSNQMVGGQFIMQTHQFFFFEKEKKYGGLRGPEIAKVLGGKSHRNIMLNSIVWDILEGKRLATRNIINSEICYVDAHYLIVATGAIPYMPPFKNDDIPGVYTAAVIQKMMNLEFTLLGKNILTIGAGNIGYLTSYQLKQAGANVVGIIEAADKEGGFPVQANRVKRLGIPIMTSNIILEATPNKNKDGISGAILAECKNFKPIPGAEKIIENIDAINICTGLVPDEQLFDKGCEVFGRVCYGPGDVLRIGEGTSAVLQGQIAAYHVLQAINSGYNYHSYLELSKAFIDSQQMPVKILDKPYIPNDERMNKKPFVIIDCLYSFACNPCVFSCPSKAIEKISASTVPSIDFEKCVGCMECVYQCPGLAIFGYDLRHNIITLPLEFDYEDGLKIYLVDNKGHVIDQGIIQKIISKPNNTNLARIKPTMLTGKDMLDIRGFIPKEEYPEELKLTSHQVTQAKTYICHCEDVKLDEILNIIGDRKYISIDEIKHTTRLGMGACRGKRCFKRLNGLLLERDISLVGKPSPRAPLSSMVKMGESYPSEVKDRVITNIGTHKPKINTIDVFIAGGGIGGSALFRYLSEEGLKPVMANYLYGSSWRNIAGGRPNFSLPELSEIARNNQAIFKKLQQIKNIYYQPTKYITFAHNEKMAKILEDSMVFSDAYMIEPKDFTREISPFINPKLDKYVAALIARNCWQASPGRVIDLIRTIGINNGGIILEDYKVVDVLKEKDIYKITVETHDHNIEEFHTKRFINALGVEGSKFASTLGMKTDLYHVKHQAFITRRLPRMGIKNQLLPMIIDRSTCKGFIAVYGQQLAETGQIIGCASPLIEPLETAKDQKINSREFIEIVSETFVDWLPELSSIGFQAIWSGYYVEPRMIIDPELGLFLGLRGQGFMLGQYLARLYVDKLLGKKTPPYFNRLQLDGDGIPEYALK